MALVYSRDGAFRPLRVLEGMLREIRNKSFNLNDTRSGRLSKLPVFEVDVEVLQFSNSVGSFEAASLAEVHKTSDMPVVKTQMLSWTV